MTLVLLFPLGLRQGIHRTVYLRVCHFIVGVTEEQPAGWLGCNLEGWRKKPLCFAPLQSVLQWEEQPVRCYRLLVLVSHRWQ